MMEPAPVNPYARNANLAAYHSVSVHGGVADANPHRLVCLLMDAALERMATARGCIERGELARKASLLHSCVSILAELRGSLNLADGGELAQNLSDLYDYMMRRLLLANAGNEVQYITETASLLEEIRGAWVAIAPEVHKSTQQNLPAARSAGVSLSSRSLP